MAFLYLYTSLKKEIYNGLVVSHLVAPMIPGT